jgi:hypothetical protein
MSTRWLIVLVSVGASFINTGSAEAQRWGRGGFGYGYGGYGMGAGSTPIGSALAGGGIYMAGAGRFMQGAGQFNQLSSMAAINYEQAYSMSLDNHLKYEQTYFQMRRENASARAEMAAMRPHYTPEQYAADNRARIPGRLSPAMWDPGRGVFVWPQNLASDEFTDDRAQVEALFAARDADPSAAGLGTDNYRQIRFAVTMMSDHLHSLIDQMSPDEYIPASKFLKALEHEARFAPGAAMASADE